MDVNKLFFDENEKPLDTLCTDGGFVGIFRTIACVGDSLASGEFEALATDGVTNQYFDRFDYSWGQYMARMAGCTVYNFSKGGMTAKDYVLNFSNSCGYWRRELAANAYVIALGVNDLLNRKWEIGSIDDVCFDDYRKNAETYAGYYATIIQRYKEISPDARFFLVTMPKASRRTPEQDSIADKQKELMYEFAKAFANTYVIDLREYGPMYDEEFRKKFYLRGHLAPTGYIMSAKLITSYMDYIIRHNMSDFRDVGLMGYDYDRESVK